MLICSCTGGGGGGRGGPARGGRDRYQENNKNDNEY
jgi:hypothetical protein